MCTKNLQDVSVHKIRRENVILVLPFPHFYSTILWLGTDGYEVQCEAVVATAHNTK